VELARHLRRDREEPNVSTAIYLWRPSLGSVEQNRWHG
jgi:hypothetical protein